MITYQYKRSYVAKDGTIKDYIQTQTKPRPKYRKLTREEKIVANAIIDKVIAQQEGARMRSTDLYEEVKKTGLDITLNYLKAYLTSINYYS